MQRSVCDFCGATIPPHAHYVVRIEVFADPTVPEMSTQELAQKDVAAEVEALLREMETMTPEELQDHVHRRFDYRLCPSCQPLFLANPLGMPRQRRIGEN